MIGGDDTTWMLQGACRGHDTDVWFSEAPEAIAYAKSVCSTCPVRVSCQEYALADVSLCWRDTGVWGSLSSDERRRIRRKRLLAQRERSA